MLEDEEEHPHKHPLSSQCPARSKRTGRRCRRMVKGGGPCAKHGGGAPQVKAKREQRLVLWEAQQQAAQQGPQSSGSAWISPDEGPARTAEEMIISALRDADEVLQLIKTQVRTGLSPALTLPLLGEWADRIARIGKVVTDGGLQDKLSERQNRMNERLAQQVAAVLLSALTAAELSDAQRAAFDAGFIQAIRAPDLEPVTVERFRQWVRTPQA